MKIENNNTYYILKNKKSLKIAADHPIIPLPLIHNKDIISFHIWYEKYEDKIEKISEEFITKIFELKSDKYLSHLNIKLLKEHFIKMLHNYSNNSCKQWI
jgi:hypothetical protein